MTNPIESNRRKSRRLLLTTLVATASFLAAFTIFAADKTTKEYDASGRIVRETTPIGGVTEYSYNNVGKITQKRIKRSADTWAEYRNEYDAEGMLLLAKFGPSGEETRYIRNDRGLSTHILTRVAEDKWSAVYLEYDRAANITFRSIAYFVDSPAEPDSGRPVAGTRYGYDGAGNLLFVIDPKRHVTAYEYSADNQRIATIDALGRRTEYERDTDGKLLKQKDPQGVVTEWLYDEQGEVIEVVGESDFAGGCYSCSEAAEAVTYTGRYERSDGRVTAFTDAEGKTTRYKYDDNGNMTEKIAPDGGKTGYAYDTDGNLTRITESNGDVREYDFNAADLPTEYRFNSKPIITLEHAIDGSVSKVIYADRAESVEYFRDPSGLVVEERKTDASGNIREAFFEYDLRGDMLEKTTFGGLTTLFEYDADGKILRKFDDPYGLSIVNDYYYDEAKNLYAIADPNGNITRYYYNVVNELVCIESPEGVVQYYQYDPASRTSVVQVDPDGLSLVLEKRYDERDRLIHMTNNATSVSREFDDDARLMTITYSGRDPVEYRYEQDDRLRSVAVRGAGGTEVIRSYEYDEAGRMLSVTNQFGGVTEYRYDAAGNLTAAIGPLGIETTYAYDAMNRETERMLSGRLIEGVEYAADGLISRVRQRNGVEYAYVYDDRGRRVERIDKNGRRRKYQYDAVDRLVSQTDELGAKTAYSYDKNGNLVALTDANDNTTSFVYNKDDQLVEIIYPDVEGAPGGSERRVYNSAGLLDHKITPNGVAVRNRYDKYGRLAAVYHGDPVAVDGEIPDERLLVAYEYDAAGTIARETGPHTSLAYAYDGLGNTIRAEDTALGLAVAYDYDAKGVMLRRQVLDATAPNSSPLASHAFRYDALGRMVSITGDNGRETTLAYADASASITYPNGVVFTTRYNQHSKRERETVERGGEILFDHGFSYDSQKRESCFTASTATIHGILETSLDMQLDNSFHDAFLFNGYRGTPYFADYNFLAIYNINLINKTFHEKAIDIKIPYPDLHKSGN